MKLKSIYLLTAVLLGFNIAAQAQKTVTIKGNIQGDLKGHNKIYVYAKGFAMDSTVVNNGVFEISVPFEYPFVPMIYDEYTVKEKGYKWAAPILVDRPGTVCINNIDIDNGFNSGTLSGMQSAVDYKNYIQQQKIADDEIAQLLQKKYGPPKTMVVNGRTYTIVSGDAEPDSLKADRLALENEKYAHLLEQFVKAHPDSFSAAYILGSTGRGFLKPDDLKKTYRMLSARMQQSDEGKNILQYLTGIGNSATGKYVENFTLNMPDEKPLSFSQFKGKYVLIDFWASWCGPCKQSFPHLKEMYKKFKSDRFEIYSISIDKSKANWLNELTRQHLPWLQSLDTSHVAESLFAVNAVPATYLVDPDGQIIIKEIGFEEGGAIETKLIELFENGKQ